MGQITNIQWCDHTFNPWRGCTKVSAGCAHCYAETLSKRNPAALGTWGDSGTRVVASEAYWKQPLKWNEDAMLSGVRRRVFCASLADVFEDRPELILPRWRLWNLIVGTPFLDWLLLTKRPANAAKWINRWTDLSGESDEPKLVRGPKETREAHPSGRGQLFADVLEAMGVPPSGCAFPTFDWMDGVRWIPAGPLPNVWIGASVENQEAAEDRIPDLLNIAATVRFISCEPMLGPLVLDKGPGEFLRCEKCGYTHRDCYEQGDHYLCDGKGPGIHWVICGGESGKGSRKFDLSWARSLRDQCSTAGVAFFMKQMGALPVNADGESIAERLTLGIKDKKGGNIGEWPEDLRVREFPTTPTLTSK